jgi:putative DNA primase/helicase
VPDHDLAGSRHAEAVRASLAGIAGKVRLIELPGLLDKGDVSDWIAARERDGRPAGDIRRHLEQLAATPDLDPRAAAAPRPAGRPSRVRRAADIAPRTVAFLWHPYIPLGKLTLLEGDPGHGKSWIAAALVTAGSRGDGLPGTPPFPPFRSLVFTAEDDLADTLRPRLDLLGAALPHPPAALLPAQLLARHRSRRTPAGTAAGRAPLLPPPSPQPGRQGTLLPPSLPRPAGTAASRAAAAAADLPA